MNTVKRRRFFQKTLEIVIWSGMAYLAAVSWVLLAKEGDPLMNLFFKP